MLEMLLAMSAVVRAATEVVKEAIVDRYGLPDWVTLLVSLAFGVFVAFGTNVNLFADNATYSQLHPIAAVAITGGVIGFGSNIVNMAYDLLYGWSKKVQQPPVTQ